MRIANPMYDAVFKHLLEDPAAAKLLVGAILGDEIESLEMVPQEAAVEVGSVPEASTGTGFTVLRVDFAATVRTAAGEHLRVLIEVQKARYSDDVVRFRRYLGAHYADRRNTVTYAEGGRERTRPRRLTTIYFLGEPLPRTAATVLKVAREYLDAVTGERLTEREEFVEALTHDCYVVQVSRLPAQRRNDLEKLLSVFDQDLRAADTRHALEVDAAAIPTRYAPVLRRLQIAAASPMLRHSMLTEDEIIGEWEGMYRDLAEHRTALAEHQKTIAEQEKTLAEQEKTLAARDATIERQRAESERQRAEIEALRRRLGDGGQRNRRE